MKTQTHAEMIEGPEAWTRFQAGMKTITEPQSWK
jgi:hypothetical protein